MKAGVRSTEHPVQPTGLTQGPSSRTVTRVLPSRPGPQEEPGTAAFHPRGAHGRKSHPQIAMIQQGCWTRLHRSTRCPQVPSACILLLAPARPSCTEGQQELPSAGAAPRPTQPLPELRAGPRTCRPPTEPQTGPWHPPAPGTRSPTGGPARAGSGRSQPRVPPSPPILPQKHSPARPRPSPHSQAQLPALRQSPARMGTTEPGAKQPPREGRSGGGV